MSSNVGWSLSTSQGKVFHDIGHGSVKLNFGTGSATKVEISGAQNLRNHGVLMVTGYGLMLLGSLVALGKNASPGVWLLAHRGIQVTGMILAAAGLALTLTREGNSQSSKPFDYSKATADSVLKAHGIMGITVVFAPVIQVVLAVLREKKDESGRLKGKRLAHVVLGWVVIIMGLANCLLGAELISRKLGDAPEPYLFAAAAMLAVAGLALAFKVFNYVRNIGKGSGRGGGKGGVTRAEAAAAAVKGGGGEGAHEGESPGSARDRRATDQAVVVVATV